MPSQSDMWWGMEWIVEATPEELREAVLLADKIGHDEEAFQRSKELYNQYHSDQLKTNCQKCRRKVRRHFNTVRALIQ